VVPGSRLDAAACAGERMVPGVLPFLPAAQVLLGMPIVHEQALSPAQLSWRVILLLLTAFV